MIVYAVEEVGEADWRDFERRNVGVYENKDKALAKQEEMEQKYKYNDYYITAYDTENGEIAND